MFNKREANVETVKADGNGNNGNSEKDLAGNSGEVKNVQARGPAPVKSAVNTILKGSKLTGDINVTCDLELSGDVEGNIRSAGDSNIIIKGSCAGNIETRGGSVELDGELKSGNIIAGSNVRISGKFNGGEVKAKGRIYVNGEFSGTLAGSEIEIGSEAKGKGEIIYDEYISISRGAKVEVQISRNAVETKGVKTSPEKKVVDIEPSAVESGTGE